MRQLKFVYKISAYLSYFIVNCPTKEVLSKQPQNFWLGEYSPSNWCQYANCNAFRGHCHKKKAIAEGSNVTTGALSSACFTVVSVYMGAWEIMEKKSR